MEVVWNLGAALEYLSRMGCRRVLVQLPQGMTHASERFLSAVEDRSMEALLWGRPAYGACDVVDPEAAGADCLLHVGHLPFPWLTPERAVFYVPPTEVDVGAVADALADRRSVALGGPAGVLPWLPRVAGELRRRGMDAGICEGRGRARWPGLVLGCNFTSLLSCRGEPVVVSDGSFHALGLALLLGRPVVRVDPLGRAETVDPMPTLRRRYALIHGASGVRSWGVIVSDIPGQRREELASFLCRSIRDAGLRCWQVRVTEVTRAVDDLGLEALANTACPRVSIEDSPMHRIPILTPFETLQALRLAAGGRLSRKYVMDVMF